MSSQVPARPGCSVACHRAGGPGGGQVCVGAGVVAGTPVAQVEAMAFDFDAFLADATPGSSATPAGTPGRRTLTASIAPAHAPRPMRALPSGTRELVLDSPATARAPVQAKLEVASR